MLARLLLSNGRMGAAVGIFEDDPTEVMFWTGLPERINLFESTHVATLIGTAYISEEALELIRKCYADGGECNDCGEIAMKLRDNPLEGEDGRICRSCWNCLIVGYTDEKIDFGKFDPDDELCTHCGVSVPKEQQHHVDNTTLFCLSCCDAHTE